jgi:hypothetical protein
VSAAEGRRMPEVKNYMLKQYTVLQCDEMGHLRGTMGVEVVGAGKRQPQHGSAAATVPNVGTQSDDHQLDCL